MKHIEIKQNKNLKKTASQIKDRINKLELPLLLLLSVLLFTVDRSNFNILVNTRTQILDKMIGIVKVITYPTTYFNDVLSFLTHHKKLIEENNKLKEENFHLRRNTLLIRMLRAENLKLRKTLNFLSPYSEIEYVTTHITSKIDNGFNQSVFIPLGSEDGIQNDQAVVNDKGLIGKTVDVGNNHSRILLITDKNFRTPVTTIESNTKAIVSGNNKDGLKLLHSPYQHKIQAKEEVVTSGNNYFPSGIYIGYVSNDKNKVIIDTNLSQIDFVSIIKLKHQIRRQ